MFAWAIPMHKDVIILSFPVSSLLWMAVRYSSSLA